MKKAILSMLVMVSLGASYGVAQTNTLLASSFVDPSSNLDDHYPLTIEETDYSESTISKRYDIPSSASIFEMDMSSNELKVHSNSDVIYTTAEILNKDSNTTVQKVQIKGGVESIDLSDVATGSYYMILSNKKGDILSEKITIL